MNQLLQMRNIRKQYPGVVALDDVSFDLNAGEVHCLLGENGAGKSTLMKILSGVVRGDAGEVVVEGSRVDIQSPGTAQDIGIGIIHQEFKLVPELSVAENILLGNEPMWRALPFIDVDRMHALAREVLQPLGEAIDTRALVQTLPIAQRQLVEIARALSRKVRILALDEPSAALTRKELQNLFAAIRRLKAEGAGVIYISHRLEEIFEIGDRVTVLRDGKHAHTCPVKETTRAALIRQWSGGTSRRNSPRLS